MLSETPGKETHMMRGFEVNLLAEYLEYECQSWNDVKIKKIGSLQLCKFDSSAHYLFTDMMNV